MLNVPSHEEFSQLRQIVERQGKQIEFLQSLLTGQDQLSLTQTAKALGVSTHTVRRLTKLNRLQPTYRGVKPFYKADDIRAYLAGKHLETDEVNNRLLTAVTA
ncbi:hypothetical protein BN8_03691 [Fibrisoma limi BUZ 3]|uniref:Helix-turn-helix domain-containing protein n=1 Tax=Fibrisoma limi BUZ 3 TaxID=1185876 RepID=I2GKT7_9BACT|nr:helix-turn-helix domain-containing protein [Fibrisoma limi]CCH54513.1 hypothetical protein BN8_03691 [Fibrisoma limi BUZ 3]